MRDLDSKIRKIVRDAPKEEKSNSDGPDFAAKLFAALPASDQDAIIAQMEDILSHM